MSYLSLSQSYPQLLSHSASELQAHGQPGFITATALAVQIYSDLVLQPQHKPSQASGAPSQQHPPPQQTSQQQLTLLPASLNTKQTRPSDIPPETVGGSNVGHLVPPNPRAPAMELPAPKAALTVMDRAVQGRQPSLGAVAVIATATTAGNVSAGGLVVTADFDFSPNEGERPKEAALEGYAGAAKVS